MTYDPTARTTGDLLRDWTAVMRELRRRDVIRTNNNPVGDIAEAIVHGHYGGVRESLSKRGYDVIAPGGERIQVKAARNTPTTKRTNLSPIRDREYDSVVAVVFDEEFQITEVMKLTREVTEDIATYKPHINGHVLYLNRLRTDPRVERIDLSDAYARLSEWSE